MRRRRGKRGRIRVNSTQVEQSEVIVIHIISLSLILHVLHLFVDAVIGTVA